jgi:hypothetical protein
MRRNIIKRKAGPAMAGACRLVRHESVTIASTPRETATQAAGSAVFTGIVRIMSG